MTRTSTRSHFICIKLLFCVMCAHFIRWCKLYHLNLSYCERLTDLAVKGLSGSSICSLDITGCHIRDQVLLARYLMSSHTPGSRKHFFENNQIQSIMYLCFKGLAKLERIRLKKIVLAECINITDIGIEVQTFHPNC